MFAELVGERAANMPAVVKCKRCAMHLRRLAARWRDSSSEKDLQGDGN